MDKAIALKQINKIYRLYNKPSDRLKEIILRRPLHREFYALRDINLEISRGETFGIIGENGAGKSTLLKILAKTLKPTSGELIINGRVAALLELGAGFNPELTGEENIYLNGNLMGITKSELNQKRQEIIDFAEIGEFVHQPVKTYSSGMQVRLAFSIATSVNPDILVVDEALSVGDEYFQKKSIDKMMGFKQRGKTIIFCSHSMYYVQEICDRVAWIHQGVIESIGTPGKVIVAYQNHERQKTAVIKGSEQNSTEDALTSKKSIWIENVRLKGRGETYTSEIDTFDPVDFNFTIRNTDKPIKGHIAFAIIRNDETMVFGTTTKMDGLKPVTIADQMQVCIKIPSLRLLQGMYNLMLIVADEHAVHPYDTHRGLNFSVTPKLQEFGIQYIEHEWKFN